MLLSRKIKLYPNNKQKTFFHKCANISNFSYNYAINKVKEYYSKEMKWNDSIIRKELTQDKKKEEFRFLSEVSCDIPKQAIKDACLAYKMFFKKVGKYPKYKGYKSKLSFYIDSYKIKFDNLKVQIPTLKNKVKMAEPIIAKNGKDMKNIRISFDGLNWYLTYSYEIDFKTEYKTTKEILGIDVGIKTYATLSDGSTFCYNKNKVNLLYKRQKRIKRKLSKYYLKIKNYTMKGGMSLKSNNICKKEIKLKKLYKKINNINNEFIHKTTNDIISKNPKGIVVEDLNIKGMIKNHKLSKSIIINSFNKFITTLSYKCSKNNINLIKADRFYPSTQMCSNCGNVKSKEDKLTLNDRIYECKCCGFKEDRDLNAAINLSKLV